MNFHKRKITDSMRTMIKRRTNSGFRSPWLIFVLSMVLVGPTIVFFVFRNIPEMKSASDIVGYCIAGYLVLAVFLIFLQNRSRRKKRLQYELVLGSGNYELIEVLEKGFNLNIRVNNIPQQIIKLKHKQEIIELKTFDLNYSELFSPGQMKVLTHPKSPGIFIPENAWLVYERKNKPVDRKYSV
ncbi:MAG: hypothetical protein R2799_11540 [Crocinitomicaceae bacterium]